MNKNNKLIPSLRFPEFQNSGEWVEKKLGECVIEKNIKTTKNNQYPILTSSKNGIILQNEYFNKQTASANNIGYKIVDFGDFTYRSMSDTGNFTFNIQYLISKGIVSPAYPVFQVIKKKIVPNFLNYYLNYSYSIKEQIYKLKQGGTRFALNFKKLSLFQIILPSLPEQQKIAGFFSNLDELIAAHKQKLALLKQHKKGLMQKLFPQEGEKLPEWRFPEFKNSGEWVEKKLGEESVSIIVNDKIDSKNLTLNNYVSTDNMLPDYSGVAVATKLPSTERVIKFIKGDVLISNIRPYLKKVWKSDKEGGSSNDILVFRSGKEVITEFLEFILKNDTFINYVMQSAKGVKMPRGDKDSMKKYIVKIPSKQEQQKIAGFLSNLDELIMAEAENIEQLERHKKGLMQRMFPVV